MKRGSYQPEAVKRVWIEKPGSADKRPLGIPTVTDRVVQAAVRMVIEPIFENRFAKHSYGFRPGRGCKDALRRVEELLRAGHTYVVDVDMNQAGNHFDFLGYRFKRSRRGKLIRLVRPKSLHKLRDTIRLKTRRNNGKSMDATVAAVNLT